ncbi:EamA family transporter [Corynebacterium casei]|uniref:EamA family transporter n=5 Tax=Corynebacterium casei TaxID=160386 RepID=UPI001D010BDD|nr:hypothetical protein [Corynebacterium casei]MDN5903686.1 hypothetical protein [Corynebacterium casei]MDN6628149.1 hypothetical protein [Corynebacterium casei]MDN6673192.1 hypothetical protein [Corynebacterium casei]
MNTSNKTMTGAVIVAVAVIWQGIGTAVVGMRVAPDLSTFTTFSAFLIAAVLSTIGYFAVKHRKQNANSERVVEAPSATKSQRVKSALALNLFSAGAFCLFYISATMIQPTAASVIETGVGPFVVAVLLALTAKRFNSTLIPTFAIVALAFAFFFIGDVSATSETYAGVLLAVGAGISAVGVLYSSRWASSQGLGVLTIAAIRFHLAWILSGIVAITSVDFTELQGNIGQLIILSTLCITLPILLLQWGVVLAPPFISALILATLPAVVMATETLLGSTINPVQIMLLVLIVVITMGQAIHGTRQS